MSNIGKQPVNIPDGVNVNIKNNNISIKGKLGELNIDFNPVIKIEMKKNIKYQYLSINIVLVYYI